MLSLFRTFTKSWVAAILLGLLIISFAVFGQHDFMKPTVKDAVITAGSRVTTRNDFKREFDRVRKNAEQQMQRPITVDEAAANNLDRRLLDDLATREGFFAMLEKIGARPSDKLVVEQIRTIPAFFDQVSGRFDQKQYEQRLAENGLTVPKFEQAMRDEIAEQQLAVAMVNGLRTPRAYSALGAIYALESRDVGYFPIDPGSVPPPPRPTDAQLTQFMKENAAQLMRPEFRVLTLVRFSPSLVSSALPVDPADVKKRYDFRRDTLSKPETRTIIQIPAKDAAAAAAIAARLAKGEAPEAVAKSTGVDVITHADKPQTAITDRQVAAAAFALAPGQVSGPIKGDLGFAVVKVLKVTPGRQVTMEEIRPQLEAEIRKDAAAEKVYEATQAYDDAHQAGANLADAARKAGVAAVTIGPVSAQGLSLQGQPTPGLSPKLLETAFALPAGGESELEDAGQGEYYAVRVEKILPSAPPPLAEIRPQLERVWMSRDLLKRLEERAKTFQARLKTGETLEAVATAAGAKVTRVVALDRQGAGENKALSRDALVKAFGAKPGGVFIASNTYPGLIVAKVENVHVTATNPNLARMTEDTRPQLTMALFQEIGDSGRKAARTEMKVKADLNSARAAIGLEPIVEAKGKGKDAKAEKAK